VVEVRIVVEAQADTGAGALLSLAVVKELFTRDAVRRGHGASFGSCLGVVVVDNNRRPFF
jgi:hypothetical protein